jgi:periplasmic protein CpxP/Spy
MEIFAKNRLLIRIVVLLIALNLISTGIFLYKDFFRKPPPPPLLNENRDVNVKRDVSVILEKELGLSEKQSEQIKNLRASFLEKEKALQETIRSQRDSMNQLMFNRITNEEAVKSLAKRVADNEYNMEILRFEQAKEFKSICTPEQMEKFEKLVKEIRDYFKPDNQPDKKPK